MKKTGKGNAWTQRREAEMNMKRHLERMKGAEVSKDLRDLRKPVPMKLISRAGGKAVAKQKRINETNKNLVKMIYETMNENRLKGSYEYAPGFRVTKGGKAVVDCYPTELGGEFHELHSGAAIAAREKKRQEKHTAEFFARVEKAASVYSRDQLAKDWQKQQRLKTAMTSTKLMPWSMYLLKVRSLSPPLQTTNPDVPQTTKEVIVFNKKREKEKKKALQEGQRPSSAPWRRSREPARDRNMPWSERQHPDWNFAPTVEYVVPKNMATSEHEAKALGRVEHLRKQVQRGYSPDPNRGLTADGRDMWNDSILKVAEIQTEYKWVPEGAALLNVRRSNGQMRTDPTGESSPYQRELARRGIGVGEIFKNAQDIMRAREGRKPWEACSSGAGAGATTGAAAGVNRERPSGGARLRPKSAGASLKSQRAHAPSSPLPQPSQPPSHPLSQPSSPGARMTAPAYAGSPVDKRTHAQSPMPGEHMDSTAVMDQPLMHARDNSTSKTLSRASSAVEQTLKRVVQTRRTLLYEGRRLVAAGSPAASAHGGGGGNDSGRGGKSHAAKFPCDVRLYDVGFIYPRGALRGGQGHAVSHDSSNKGQGEEGDYLQKQRRIVTNDFVPLSYGIEVEVTLCSYENNIKMQREDAPVVSDSVVLNVRDLVRIAGQRASGDEELEMALSQLRCLHRQAKLYESLGMLAAATEDRLHALVVRSFDIFLSADCSELMVDFLA